MKHTYNVILLLVGFFLLTQFVGLGIVSQYIDYRKSMETGNIEWRSLPYDMERPEVEDQSISFIPIVVAVLIGTLLVLWLVRINKPFIWRLWFFFTVLVTLSIAFAAFLDPLPAFLASFILTLLRIYRPNILTQNISEIFIYGGLASVFVPILNLFAAFMLLAIISVYDMIAVWKTKHMIRLAEFQKDSKVFSGLMVKYRMMTGSTAPKKSGLVKLAKMQKTKSSIAVLGGGDMGFPLIFAGVVMKGLMLQEAFTSSFLKASIIPVTTAVALLILLINGQRNRYYPAMPFLSLGAVIGYFIILLL
ncbi:hypothetical protein HYX09_04125 [Candidatus Woesearchaeota archaeon]|nr:hypothetical protein [Candidatus Woesearchaeota archaeon]